MYQLAQPRGSQLAPEQSHVTLKGQQWVGGLSILCGHVLWASAQSAALVEAHNLPSLGRSLLLIH